MPLDAEQRKARADRLRESLQRLIQTPHDVYTRPTLGELSFEVCRPFLEQLTSTAAFLNASPIEALPPYILAQTANAFDSMESRLKLFVDFDIVAISGRNENPVVIRRNYLGEWDNNENTFWAQIAPAIGYIAAGYIANDPGRQAASNLVEEAKGAIKKAEGLNTELLGIVKAARDAAADVGVSRHATLFATESTAHDRASKWWLGWTVVLALGTAAAAVANIKYSLDHPVSTEAPLNIQLTIAKVLLLSVLLSATVWCGRVYRALRHNVVVNRHRQNALSSFEAFVQAATDDQTKNAVLLHAAQSIFSPQSSGYSGAESDASTGGTQMVELIRTISPTQK